MSVVAVIVVALITIIADISHGDWTRSVKLPKRTPLAAGSPLWPREMERTRTMTISARDAAQITSDPAANRVAEMGSPR